MIALGLRRVNRELLTYVEEIIQSGQWCRYYDLQGHYQDGMVTRFESWAQHFLGKRFVLATTSGTQSLALALSALDVKGKEVIIPTYSFVACAIAVLCAGATPVVAPVNDRLVLDPEAVAALTNDNTGAIMAVHMRGIVNDVRTLYEIAHSNGCALLEDCSQFDGLTIRNSSYSSVSDAYVYSLQARKILSAGEGGMIATDSEELYSKLFAMHDPIWFMRSNLPFTEVKDNCPLTAGCRMNEITAAVLLHQTEGFRAFLDTAQLQRQKLITLIKDRVPLMPAPPIDYCDGVSVVLRASNSNKAKNWKKKLLEAQLRLYPESANEQDPHFYMGWPERVLSQCLLHADLARSRELLSCSVLLQLDPDWTDEEIEQQANRIIMCLS